MRLRTIVILAVRSEEEGRALQRCAGRTELLHLGHVVWEGGRVLVRLCRLGGVVVPAAHSGECTEVYRGRRQRNSGRERAPNHSLESGTDGRL